MKDLYKRLGHKSKEWGSKPLKEASRALKASLRKLTREEWHELTLDADVQGESPVSPPSVSKLL